MVFVVIINETVQFQSPNELDCRNYILSIKNNLKFGDQIAIAEVIKTGTVSINVVVS